MGLGVAVTVIPVAAMIAFIKVMGADIAHVAGDEFKKSAIQSARQATVDIRQMCDVIQLSDENRMALARAAVMSALEELGEASLDRRVADRTIRSQSAPGTEQRRRLRLLKFGAETVDPAQPLEMPGNRIGETLLRLKKRLSCDFTIYQRISYDGDMLRVATTKTDENGKSLAGLYVPGLLRSGAKSRLADNILGGSEFSDTSDASGAPFLVGYMPVFDRRGEVIGAVNYGMRQDSKHEIEKYLQAFTIGQSGSVWVIDEAAPGGPTLRVTNDPSAEGMRIDDDPVAARRDFLKRALAKSKKMRSGEIDAELMIIPMGDGNKDAHRLMTFTYYSPWKWVIGTSTNGEEFYESEIAVHEQTNILTRKVIYAGSFFMLLAIGIAWMLASRFAKPLKMLMQAAIIQSDGDISGGIDIINRYWRKKRIPIVEFKVLIDSFLEMSERLCAVVAGVRKSGYEITARAAEVSETSLKLESISEYESASIRRVAAAGKTISNSYDALNKAAVGSTREVAKTLRTSRGCGENISLLKRNYDSLTLSAEGVVERLALIRENVGKITEVVAAINEISRRTNLLSLNASIEAEKAGELGLGFSVVARQIRSLADRTSRSSREIEDMAERMRDSVSLGAREMDKFVVRLRQNSSIIMKTAEALERVVDDVESIGPKFEDIAGRIAALSESARGISQSMGELSAASERSQGRISDFKAATESLEGASGVLLGEVSKFKISGKGESK